MAYVPRIRLYIDQPLALHTTLELDADHSHYVCNVMRQQEGNNISVFNARDGEWDACLDVVHKKHTQITIVQHVREAEKSLSLGLAFAPVKNVAQHFIVQKATEMGVSDLYPVVTQHTVIHRVNMGKLQANAIEAAEQCERVSVPVVHALQSLEQFLTQVDDNVCIVFCDESGQGEVPGDLVQHITHPVIVLIGPEGGFSDKERAYLRDSGRVISFSMGPRILRADTAAIAALTYIQSTIGDWHIQPRGAYGS